MDQKGRLTKAGSALRWRREQLGMTREDVVEKVRAGGGKMTLSNLAMIETGQRPNPQTRTTVSLSRALGWPDDAVLRIYEGADPAEFDEEQPEPPPRQIDELVRTVHSLQREVKALSGDQKDRDGVTLEDFFGMLTREQWEVFASAFHRFEAERSDDLT